MADCIDCDLCGCCNICDVCCGCCEICSCCCSCCVLAVVGTVLGLACLITWLIFRPTAFTVDIAGANLTQFDLDPNNNILHYNLSFNISIRNPNSRLGIVYEQFVALGFYGDQRFAATNLPPFYQERKNTTVVGTVFEGQNLVVLGDGDRKNLDEDEKSGVYRISVKVVLKSRFKILVWKMASFTPKIKCDLKVPLRSNNATSSGSDDFQTTKCTFDY